MKRLAVPVIGLALLVLAFAAQAAQNDARLDGLFARLKSAANPIEARLVEEAIWQIWLISNDARANALMARGIGAMNRGDNARALAAFDDIVRILPGFAEGWNKRATVHFMLGNLLQSITDVEETLALEPRHFGALSGLGQIYLLLGDESGALSAFEQALAVHPHLDGARAAVDALVPKVRGRAL